MEIPNIILAPNSYKSSIDACKICNIIEKELSTSLGEKCHINSIPVGDGGDGTGAILAKKLCAIKRYYNTTNPFGKKISVPIYLKNKTAIIEMSDIVGLKLLKPKEYNPKIATTVGIGIVIKKLYLEGINNIVLCAGGSSTIDMGLGILQGLGAKLYDEDDKEIEKLEINKLHRIKRIDSPTLHKYKKIKIDLLCDVKNTLLGENGAIRVYGKQKGVKIDEIQTLEENHLCLANVIEQQTNIKLSDKAHSGAAGGIAICLASFLNTRIHNGIDYVLDFLDFDKYLKDCKILITGEGCMDTQTSFGKAPYIVAERASRHCIYKIAINGQTLALPNIFDSSFSIIDYSIDIEDAIVNADKYILVIAKKIVEMIIDRNLLS